MYFALIKNFDGLTYYGYIPNLPDLPDERVEVYELSLEDVELFDDDLNSINNHCNSLLDISDIDFLNVEKCILLKEWLLNRIDKKGNKKYLNLLTTLLNFLEKAIELNTGVVIEL